MTKSKMAAVLAALALPLAACGGHSYSPTERQLLKNCQARGRSAARCQQGLSRAEAFGLKPGDLLALENTVTGLNRAIASWNAQPGVTSP
jgi:hypothetical protein